MSYEPDGTSPNPSPEAPPDANVNAVAATQPAPDLGPAPVATATPAPAPAAAPPEKPGMWKRVLVGALTGLEMGGPVGALMGAGDPAAATAAKERASKTADARVAGMQSQVRMQNAQASDLMTQAYLRQAQIDQMPEELRLKQVETEGKQADVFLNHGVPPFASVADDSDKAATDAFNAVAGANGNVMPGVVVFHMGHYRLAFKVGDLSKNVGVFGDVNVMNRIRGGPQFDSSDWFNPKSPSVPQPLKDKQVADLSHFYSPIGKSRDDNNSLKMQYQGYIRTVQAWPDSDPEKAPALEKLNAAVDVLDKAYQGVKADKTADINTGANARGAAYNKTKYDQFVDQQGQAVFGTNEQAAANGWTKFAPAERTMGKTATMNEMQIWAQSGQQAIGGLPDHLSPFAIARITAATRTTEPKILDQIKDSVAGAQQLTPAEKKFTVWYVNMAERVLSLRQMAPVGQGSDKTRAAMVALVSSAKSGDKDLMQMHLDALLNEMAYLRKGIVKMHAASAPSSGRTMAPAPAPTAPPANDFFSQFGGKARP